MYDGEKNKNGCEPQDAVSVVGDVLVLCGECICAARGISVGG